MRSDQSLFDIETTLLLAAMWAAVVFLLVRALARKRPDLAIGRPTLVAFGVRALGAAAVSSMPVAGELRGPDEPGFVSQAGRIAGTGLTSSDSLTHLKSALHTWVFSLQLRVFGDL